MLVLDGHSLTVKQVARAARENEQVEISKDAMRAVEHSREFVEKKIAAGGAIYGLNTGFGKFSDVAVSREDARALQRNLILSHSCASGEPYDTAAVRAAMLLRCNALAKGFSGIRPQTLETLLQMLNRGVHPIVPCKGSLGASGDLAPLAHIALVLIGEGEAEFGGEVMRGGGAMKRAGVAPVELCEKEGLALINGTQMMAAVGCLALFDMLDLLDTADVAAAMTCEAQLGLTSAFDERIMAARPHAGQATSAANLRSLLKGSSLAFEKRADKVQDAYSVRCTPQVHGASRDAAQYVLGVLEREINSATDNPLIFPDTDGVISGGNFHGQPLALALDFLGIAAAELANISERRLERMVNPQLSFGLPAFLAEHGGVNSGFMIVQYAAASMVSENKILAHPASVDSIPSSANQEDHVSMGAAAAKKCRAIIDNAQKVLGLELFAAAQALDMRGIKNASPATRAVHSLIRADVPYIKTDCAMYPHIRTLDSLVKRHEITHAARSAGAQFN